MVRLVPLVLGGVAIAVGAMLTALSGDPLPTKWLQDVAIIVTTMLVAGVAVFGLLVRSLRSSDETGLADEDFGPSVRTPGDDVDRQLANSGGRASGTRTDLRDRFEAAAVTRLVREHGCSPAQARELLAAGTWTDDEDAAQFFADEPGDGSTGGSLREWLRALLTGESAFAKRADRASAALFGEDES